LLIWHYSKEILVERDILVVGVCVIYENSRMKWKT
jgi:hypothetical protein